MGRANELMYPEPFSGRGLGPASFIFEHCELRALCPVAVLLQKAVQKGTMYGGVKRRSRLEKTQCL